MSTVARLTAKKKIPRASHRKFASNIWAEYSSILVSALEIRGFVEFCKSSLAQSSAQFASCDTEANSCTTLRVHNSTKGSASAKFAPLASQNRTRSSMALNWYSVDNSSRVLAPWIKAFSSAICGNEGNDDPASESSPEAEIGAWSADMWWKIVVWLEEPRYPGFGYGFGLGLIVDGACVSERGMLMPVWVSLNLHPRGTQLSVNLTVSLISQKILDRLFFFSWMENPCICRSQLDYCFRSVYMLVVYGRRLASFSYMLHMLPIETTYL